MLKHEPSFKHDLFSSEEFKERPLTKIPFVRVQCPSTKKQAHDNNDDEHADEEEEVGDVRQIYRISLKDLWLRRHMATKHKLDASVAIYKLALQAFDRNEAQRMQSLKKPKVVVAKPQAPHKDVERKIMSKPMLKPMLK